MAFKRNNPGCPCCDDDDCPTSYLTVALTHCSTPPDCGYGGPLLADTLTITKGAFVATCSDCSGLSVDLADPGAGVGTYTITGSYGDCEFEDTVEVADECVSVNKTVVVCFPVVCFTVQACPEFFDAGCRYTVEFAGESISGDLPGGVDPVDFGDGCVLACFGHGRKDGLYHGDCTLPICLVYGEEYDYTVTFDNCDGYQGTITGTVTADCSNGEMYIGVTVNAIVEDEFVCGDCCGKPLPKTLFYSDPYGACVLTYYGYTPAYGQIWTGCMEATCDGYHYADCPYTNTSTCVPQTITSPQQIILSCAGGHGQWEVYKFYSACHQRLDCSDPVGFNTAKVNDRSTCGLISFDTFQSCGYARGDLTVSEANCNPEPINLEIEIDFIACTSGLPPNFYPQTCLLGTASITE